MSVSLRYFLSDALNYPGVICEEESVGQKGLEIGTNHPFWVVESGGSTLSTRDESFALKRFHTAQVLFFLLHL